MDYNSYGQELRSARERSGLSLQAVADALHLDPRLIEAIEGEDASSLPAPAYVRGYIRAYAQLVRCEPDTLIARYNTRAKSDPDLVASVHTTAAFKQQRDARLMWAGTGVVVSLIMVVVGGWLLIENLFNDPPEDAAVAAVPPAIVADPPLEAPGVSEPLPEASTALPSSDTAGVPQAPGPVAQAPSNLPGREQQPQIPAVSQTPATPPVQASNPAPAAQAPKLTPPAPAQAAQAPVVEQPAMPPEEPVITDAQTGNDRLSLALDGVSWIEVLDANGERLVYGLFDERNQSLSVRGQAPFDITIGDANHVDVSVNGQVVSSEPYIRRNNSARFKAEPSVPAQ